MACDARCVESYSSHPHRRIVPHFSNFQTKIDRVLSFVEDALQIDGLIASRTRTAVSFKTTEKVDLATVSEALGEGASLQAFVVTTIFDHNRPFMSVRRKANAPVEFWFEALRGDGRVPILKNIQKKF